MDFLNADFLETASVVSHVAAGFTALVMAPLAMMTQKGGSQHRRWGKIYFGRCLPSSSLPWHWSTFALISSFL